MQPQTSNLEAQQLVGIVGSLPGALAEPVRFVKDTSFTTFTVEYAMRGPDLVFHFYLPPEVIGGEGASHASQALQRPSVYHYWSETFGDGLNQVAPEYFQATAPRLQAAYSLEVYSWWLRARGFDHLLDIPAFVRGFLVAFDTYLDPFLQNVVKL
jgi:hypothetical protein